MDKRRTRKIGSQMQREISKILRDDLNDPRLDGAVVSVTDVEVTNDLSYATVYVSVLGADGAEEKVFEALNQAKGYIKLLIGERMRLRLMPEFRFVDDKSIERGAYMDKLIEETIKKDEEGHAQQND